MTTIYEAVVFSKIIHQLFIHMLESTQPPAEIRRLRLAAEFRKLPRKWSVICTRHDLHLYSEVEDSRTLDSASGVYSELAKSHHIRLLHLLSDADAQLSSKF